jgi:hypothetical protein
MRIYEVGTTLTFRVPEEELRSAVVMDLFRALKKYEIPRILAVDSVVK